MSALKAAICRKMSFILGAELWGSRYELFRIVKSMIWEVHKTKLYVSGTVPLQCRSRQRRYGVCHRKGKFDRLEGGESRGVVYGSAQLSRCEVRGYCYHLSIIIIMKIQKLTEQWGLQF